MITYNHGRFIAQAIESVLMQETDFPVELVVGEDCSTDETLRVVLEYAKKYPYVVRAILHEHNVGASANALAVEMACRGQYIAYLEGDDYWTEATKLQKQVRMLESNPSYCMCGSATRIMVRTSDGDEVDAGLIEPKELKPYYILTDFLGGYPMHSSSIMIRRGLVVFPSWMNGVTNRDTCFLALHAEKGPAGYVNEVTSCYRLHAGGIWSGKSLLDRARSQRRTYDSLNSHFGGRYHRLLRRWEFRDAKAASRTLVEQGIAPEARKIFREALPRLVLLMPLRVLAWGVAVHLGYRFGFAWKRLRTDLAIRTRLQHVLRRFATGSAK